MLRTSRRRWTEPLTAIQPCPAHPPPLPSYEVSQYCPNGANAKKLRSQTIREARNSTSDTAEANANIRRSTSPVYPKGPRAGGGALRTCHEIYDWKQFESDRYVTYLGFRNDPRDRRSAAQAVFHYPRLSCGRRAAERAGRCDRVIPRSGVEYILSYPSTMLPVVTASSGHFTSCTIVIGEHEMAGSRSVKLQL